MTDRVPVVVAIDQGTTNTKAALVTATGELVGLGSAPVGVTSPRPGWVEQDGERIWRSVLAAVESALAASRTDVALTAIALSTQRESVLAWRASTGKPVGPVLGWQDSRTAAWCAENVRPAADEDVHRRTGLRVDAMFSAPKLRWLLDHLPHEVPTADVRVGTIDAWLIWKLTGGRQHCCEAGNASRTLLYDVSRLEWSDALLETFGIPSAALPEVRASDAGFGRCVSVGPIPAGTPINAVLADSHAALFGHGCTEPGMAKATYGTGSSVMTPVAELPAKRSSVPTTLAWLIEGRPTYALEGNILSSGATLAWAADLLTSGRVDRLVALAATTPSSDGVTLVPAFAGLGAPHWDRDAVALISGMTTITRPSHIARAAVEAVGHQIADIVDVIETEAGPLRTVHADGGATASDLVMQDQADLIDRVIEVSDVTEVSALGSAKLAWQASGQASAWIQPSSRRRYSPQNTQHARRLRRARWATEIARASFVPDLTSG